MITLNAAYYIDEVNELIDACLGENKAEAFYKQNCSFQLQNAPQFIDGAGVPPLLKVAWNILNRGDVTRASLKLSNDLLNEYLIKATEFSYSRAEIRAHIDLDNKIDKGNIKEVLDGFNNLEESDIFELGRNIFGLYRLLRKTLQYAYLQKTIVLLMMFNPEETFYRINGITEEEASLLIEDLNDLFSSLNDLSNTEEVKINLIKENSLGNIIDLSFIPDDRGAIIISDLPEYRESSLNFNILTDRCIYYGKLGKVLISEITLPNGERKETQEFKYTTQKQQNGLQYILQNIFRKTEFRPGQEAIINRALIGKDVIGLLPTGGGKSLTFQICALLHPGITIVVDPINSLMKDQYDKLIDNGIKKVSFINSFNTKEERELRMRELAEGKYLIMFVGPERLQMENFRQSLSSCSDLNVYFSYAVIDEAHCVSEWGHDFRHVYLNLADNLKRYCKPKEAELTVFGLTATASFDVLADVQRELKLKEEAIISLPAEAIDRKELNFSIVPINLQVDEGMEYWMRERKLGLSKYPVIKQLLHDLPATIQNLEKKYGYITEREQFYEPLDGSYENAGVIFCPTKSAKLPNGVMHLAEGRNNQGGGLSDLPFLKIRTFFGSGGDNSVVDNLIEAQAKESYQNQEDFIKNRANLMIATKAFGMGIDKPNIRYSLHYSFPNSIESFYQEAGRAGRDGNPSLCSIIYHPADIETNLDFYQNAFRGIYREKQIIDELLEEVQYEDGFYVKVLKQQIRDRFPEVKSVNLYNNRYIYINGPYHAQPEDRIKIGVLDLLRGLRSYDNATQNFDRIRAEEILDYARAFLNENCPNGEYLDWFNTVSTPGIRTLIEGNTKENYTLKIGFTNGIVSKIKEVINGTGYVDFNERIIRAAYNFSTNENDFIESLGYQYYNFQKNKYGVEMREFHVNPDTERFLLDNFSRIRNSQDTQRAIYRFNILGVIDDYVIDYVGQLIEIRFRAKSDREYLENFKTYLRRYLGIETSKKWLEKVNTIREDSVLKRVLYVLVEFIESEISQKRRRAIEYMRELCEVYLSEGEREFRDRMIRYFTSKYARTDYLPADTDKGTKENCAIVEKYINYIDNPPDGLGGQIDNAKHLRGACDNLRISMTENASIDLLTSFSLLALELTEEDTLETATEKPLVSKAIQLYRSGFRRMLRIETWDDVKSLICLFNNKVLDFNSEIEPLMINLSSELLVNRTHFKLKGLLDKITKS